MGAPLRGETLRAASSGLAADGTLDSRTVVAVAFVAAVRGDLVGCRFGRAVELAKGARFAITPVRRDRIENILVHRG